MKGSDDKASAVSGSDPGNGALIASGQIAQIPYHLNRAMDNGLTKAQASEVLAHLAFYAGWPNVFSALPVAKGVFEKRPG
jgi:4-carboxymuconolactone decarboxylase